MKFSKMIVTSALVAAAMGVASGTAYADPTPPAPTSADINYESAVDGRTIVTTIDAGAFKIADDGKTVDVLDAKDKVVVTLPLTFNLGGLNFPYEKNVDNDGKTLRLVPQVDLNKASLRSADLPGVSTVASTEENLIAQNTFASQLGIATAVGGLTGTIVGAIAGCVLTTVALCLPGLVTGAGIGGVIGTIVAGGPTLVVAGLDLLNTLNAAPGTTKFADSIK